MIRPVYIVDIFEDIVKKVSTKLLPQLQAIPKSTITGVHYLYGHYNEIQRRLIEKGNSNTEQYNRYPLIALFQDFSIKKGSNQLGFYGEANLQFMILYHTKQDSYSETRMENVFKPILYPIYFEFLNQIKKTGKFHLYSDKGIDHEQIDRPNWGRIGSYGNDGYILGDVLDGIEIKNLILKTRLKIC